MPHIYKFIDPGFVGGRRDAYRAWTRNEACGKALKCGLLLPVPAALQYRKHGLTKLRSPDVQTLAIDDQVLALRSFKLPLCEMSVAITLRPTDSYVG